MFERPILFYSDYCIHSTNYLNALMKHHDLFELFIRINIDVDTLTKKRPAVFYDIQRQLNIKITEIPTIITPGPENILTGEEAFEWLEFQTRPDTDVELTGFNPIEMGSFSDSYSTYGCSDMNDAKEQSFKFLTKPDTIIETPPETSNSISKDDYSRKQQERDTFDTSISNTIPIPNNKPINTSFNGNNDNNKFSDTRANVSEKQKEFDFRLQQLLSERESFGNTSSNKLLKKF